MKRAIERESSMPEAAGVAPNARVVLMTADGGSIDITDAAGDLLILARGTLPVPSSDRAALAEGARCSPSLAVLCKALGRCEGRCAAASPPTRPAAIDPAHHLTGREAQVVAHVRQGFTNKEIARRLGIQEDTVKKHLQAVFGKLGVRRRALVALGGVAMQAPSAS
jgi:DNA-binding NarL/FixJ family response regulator